MDYEAIANAARQLAPGIDPNDVPAVLGVWSQLAGQHEPAGLVDEYRVTDLALHDVIGPEAGQQFVDAIDVAATAGKIPRRIPQWLAEEGIDVADATVRGALQSLATGGFVDPDDTAEVLALAEITRPRWPGLTAGNVQRALRSYPA